MWVCRCVCGYYTLRTSKALKNERNKDACDRCRDTIWKKRRATYLQLGYNPDEKGHR